MSRPSWIVKATRQNGTIYVIEIQAATAALAATVVGDRIRSNQVTSFTILNGAHESVPLGQQAGIVDISVRMAHPHLDSKGDH